jgi:hypothetical protein
MSNPEPITAADLWRDMTDEQRAPLEEFYILIGDELWNKDDVPRCDDCKAFTFDLYRDCGDAKGPERCWPCHQNARAWADDNRGQEAWANHVRGG